MLKWTSTLAVALTATLLTGLLIYGLPRSSQVPATSDIVMQEVAGAVPQADPATLDLQKEAYQAREVAYQQQTEALAQTLNDRQSAYQQQIAELSLRQLALATRLQQAATREAALSQQIAALHAARSERLIDYQAQVEQVQREYDARYHLMSQQYAEVQTKLAEANSLLGR